MKTYIVSVSGGLSSFGALYRVLQHKSRNQVKAVFADVGTVHDRNGKILEGEDEDVYRFLDDIERVLDFPIERIRNPDYKSVWDTFHKVKMMGSTLRDPCSRLLKRTVLENYIQDNGYTARNSTRVIGFGWMEINRAEKYKAYMDAHNWKCWFPLITKPYWDNTHIAELCTQLGLKVPRLYHLGFSHNNCGGFCVKMGLGQSYDLWKSFPERYAYHEAQEQKFRKENDKDVTILRKGGVPITLKALRKLFEEGYIPDTSQYVGCGGRCLMPEQGEVL
jgi:3'-phosphoadenosine 5'-phosphosulfate sulfotransferase (PAPS reductase)/FAD synthetase